MIEPYREGINGRATYVKVDAYGNVIERYRVDEVLDNPDLIPLTDRASIDLLMMNLSNKRALYKDGVIVLKPKIIMTSDKQEYIAGVETAIVSLVGIPEEVTSVSLKVGDTICNVPVGETLEVGSSIEQHIVIYLNEPILWAEPITIRFIPQG